VTSKKIEKIVELWGFEVLGLGQDDVLTVIWEWKIETKIYQFLAVKSQ
jgi:hypothetical protein